MNPAMGNDLSMAIKFSQNFFILVVKLMVLKKLSVIKIDRTNSSALQNIALRNFLVSGHFKFFFVLLKEIEKFRARIFEDRYTLTRTDSYAFAYFIH